MAGSFRRRKETIGDVDLLAQCEGDGTAVVDHFVAYPNAERVEAAGRHQGQHRAALGPVHRPARDPAPRASAPPCSTSAAPRSTTWPCDPRGAAGAARERVGRLPRARGVDPDTLGQGGRRAGRRRDRGRRLRGRGHGLGAAGAPGEPGGGRSLPARGRCRALVTLEDIRGDLQMHSTWSDGKASVEKMALAVPRPGLRLHGHHRPQPGAGDGAGAHAGAGAGSSGRRSTRCASGCRGIEILRSCEVDILRDGIAGPSRRGPGAAGSVW